MEDRLIDQEQRLKDLEAHLPENTPFATGSGSGSENLPMDRV